MLTRAWHPPLNRTDNIPLHTKYNCFCRYLEYEHYRYCVPSDVSSGFASLPLAHVWYDGKKNTSWPTKQTLSNGDKLNGSEAYAMILPYFTTNDMTPMDVHNLGKEQLAMLYPLVSV